VKTSKVSIITTVFNAASELEKTILSVAAQDYPNLEYVIIDGGSTDGTVEVIKKHQRQISYWISEKDRGISDAFNKGVKASTGNFINFQGAGDVLLAKDVVSRMMDNISGTEMILCGRIKRQTLEGETIFETGLDFQKWQLLYKMALPHQALFVNRNFFDRYGLFDLACKYAMDYELLLRAYRDFPPVCLKDIFVSGWQEGGIGTDRIAEVLSEYHRIRVKNQVLPVWLLWMIWKASLISHNLAKKKNG
jgi:glycosyltransferase involved in cell wall biosynthesis